MTIFCISITNSIIYKKLNGFLSVSLIIGEVKKDYLR